MSYDRRDEDYEGPPMVSCAESRSDDRPSGEHCDHCGLEFSLGYRPDPCMGGYLPGVMHACCGHGDLQQAYVTLGAGVPDQAAWSAPCVRLSGQEALDCIERLRRLAATDP